MEPRIPSQSITEQIHLINHADLNGYKRLFGGTLLSWIDIVAAVAARRYCGRNVTTLSIDSLRFLAPAYANDLLVLRAAVTCVGRTSMEVCVRTYIEDNDPELNAVSRRLINEAFVVLVALDENEKPVPVPPLLPETAAEKRDYEAGLERRKLRDALRSRTE